MDPRERFQDLADLYERHRPDYPDALVEACARYARMRQGSVVVDLGCGTGISSRRFAAHGYRVLGVEPNEAMLARARATGGGPEYHRGEAARTGLPDACAGLVVAGQALHWFDMAACLPEWRRVLAPGGACAAFWNYRRQDGWQAGYEALLRRFSTEYPVIEKAIGTGDDNSGWVKASPECREIEAHEFENAQSLDWEGLLGRAASSSYVLHGVADRAGFEVALRALFDEHAREGRVAMRYRTSLLLWRLAPAAAPAPAPQ
jgi:SAM-dependent methyltransferase